MCSQFRNYCEDCEWTASTETHTRVALSRVAIDHVVETGHDINSESIAEISVRLSDRVDTSDTVG